MKHIITAAVLLMTSASAFAANQVSSNFEDPNNKFSELGKTQKKPCPFKNATGGNVEQPRMIHADLQVQPQNFNRARGTGQII